MSSLKKVILTVFIVLSFIGTSFAFDDGDFQYWNTESISYKINDEWKMKLEEEFRFGDDASDFYYQHSDLGATYKGLADWLEVGLNFRLIFEEDGDSWLHEYRPHLNATLKYKLEDFKLSNRGRMEFRVKQKGDDSWRYRNKFTIKYPVMIEKIKFSPYIADEIFMDFDIGELNRNRLYGGIDFELPKYLKLDIFYLWQTSKKSKHWINYHVLGTKLKLSF